MTVQTLKGKILAVGPIKEYPQGSGKLSIGFKIQESWYNVRGTQEQLEEVTKELTIKGNEIEFDWDSLSKEATNIKVLKVAEKESSSWKDDMVDFEDLLNYAHDKFKDKLTIQTELISVDFEKKNALFKAKVIIDINDKSSQHFEGHGDATSENLTNVNIQPHFIRMAETRAIARALRWATNNAKVCDVELTDKKDVIKKK